MLAGLVSDIGMLACPTLPVLSHFVAITLKKFPIRQMNKLIKLKIYCS